MKGRASLRCLHGWGAGRAQRIEEVLQAAVNDMFHVYMEREGFQMVTSYIVMLRSGMIRSTSLNTRDVMFQNTSIDDKREFHRPKLPTLMEIKKQLKSISLLTRSRRSLTPVHAREEKPAMLFIASQLEDTSSPAIGIAPKNSRDAVHIAYRNYSSLRDLPLHFRACAHLQHTGYDTSSSGPPSLTALYARLPSCLPRSCSSPPLPSSSLAISSPSRFPL